MAEEDVVGWPPVVVCDAILRPCAEIWINGAAAAAIEDDDDWDDDIVL